MRKRIVIVAHDVHAHGGMERHLAEVIARMGREYEVTVLTNTYELEPSDQVKVVPVWAPAKPFPLRYMIFAVLASLKLLRLKADLVHTTGSIVWNKADLSTVHFCHAGYVEACGDTRSKRSRSWLRRINSAFATQLSLAMERYSYRPRLTRRLIAVSERVKQELYTAFPYRPNDVAIVPNGVDLERFRVPDDEARRGLRRRHGLPERGEMVLFMGGDWERKGLNYVLDAFNDLAFNHPGSFVVVVGKGDPQSYRTQLLPLLQDRVHFVGVQRNAEDWFAMADLFVSPSSYETFSMVVHEAAACGLPVVSTRVGGVEDFIQEGETGLYIERDTISVKLQLGRLLGSPELRKRLGAAARRKVERLTWDHTYEKLKNVYEELLRDKAAGEREYRHELRHP